MSTKRKINTHLPYKIICKIIAIMFFCTIYIYIISRYFGLAIYCLMCLLADYLGRDHLIHVGDVTEVRLNTFPLCCCCPCLPKPKFNMYVILFVHIYYSYCLNRKYDKANVCYCCEFLNTRLSSIIQPGYSTR